MKIIKPGTVTITEDDIVIDGFKVSSEGGVITCDQFAILVSAWLDKRFADDKGEGFILGENCHGIINESTEG